MGNSEDFLEDNRHLSRQVLLKILDNSYDAIFATDSNGVTIYANKASERYYGIRPVDVIGKDSWQFMEKAGCFPPVAPIVLDNKGGKHTFEQTTRTGAKMLVTTTSIYNEDGNLEFLVQNCRDIKQLEDTKQDLEQTKHMLRGIRQEGAAVRKREIRDVTLVANSRQMQDVLELADRVADVDINILILGESGTGKSALAKYIHKAGFRKEGPFISINCAAIPNELIESELFGYVAGAFTGANQKGKAGRIELANEGTLFLDEIAEIPLRLQGKILEVIQERRFLPVGGCTAKQVTCRIITATNKNIRQMVEQGKFREDLYYRLNVMELELRPLRGRPEDTLALIYYFLNQFNKKYKKEHSLSFECRDLLLEYSWPGNIRELENMIERLAVTVQDSVINTHHLPAIILDTYSKKIRSLELRSFQNKAFESNALDKTVSELERKVILEAFRKYGSSRKVAHALNISQSRAHRLMEKYCVTSSHNKKTLLWPDES
ncbi:sigma-54 interaction domain-containing protein [Sporomusa sp.]|uniref:sigma-54 interaction domain-containing protein n=1 Tax=Sporomusa sp. TaxID=2078658 RepID=UPI002C09A26E|nr:sigma 54-interacting transcriptional regulator [Sporomusa sp.]HWR41731.1 sigma 54-interacting transcriptional regulator [Sporomusa sp.]